jgi:hypothetical protein
MRREELTRAQIPSSYESDISSYYATLCCGCTAARQSHASPGRQPPHMHMPHNTYVHLLTASSLAGVPLPLQRFRAVRPLVDNLLQGYDPRFLGMLEDASDGVGLWSTPDLSLIGIVTNPTFPSLLKLIGRLKLWFLPSQAAHACICYSSCLQGMGSMHSAIGGAC